LQNNKFFKKLPRHKIVENLMTSIDVLMDRSGFIFISSNVATQNFPDKIEKSDAAELSALLVNSAIIGLDFVIRQRNNSVSGRTKDFIGSEIDNYNLLLDSVQNELELFRQNHKVFELEEQTKSIVSQANNIAVDLAKAEVELSLGKRLYAENSQNYKILKESYDILMNQYNKIQTGGITPNDKFSIPLTEIPTLIRQYTNLVRDQKLYEQILIYLRTNYYQEAIQEKRDVPQVDVLDWAQTPNEKEAPSYKFLLIIFTILNLAIISIYLYITSRRKN
jgi:capsule polysaccharide export protein KpsE/RkpR